MRRRGGTRWWWRPSRRARVNAGPRARGGRLTPRDGTRRGGHRPCPPTA
jgi:hypothetical protein